MNIYLNLYSLVLKKTFESIFFDRRRGIEDNNDHSELNILLNKIAVAENGVKSVDIQQQ